MVRKKQSFIQPLVWLLMVVLTIVAVSQTKATAQPPTSSPTIPASSVVNSSISASPTPSGTVLLSQVPTLLESAKPEVAVASQRSLKSPPNGDKPTEVSIGFYVLNLSRINQTEQTADVTGFLYATWEDKRLAFDPAIVGDKVKRYTPEQIWEPSLTIFNSQSLQKKGQVQLIVSPDGSVAYLELVNVTLSSGLDLRKFPFDSQTVKIIWEPLSSDVKGVVLKENAIATGYSKDSYTSLAEWQILSINGIVTLKKAEKEDKSYPRYTFEIHIKRNFEFYLLKIFMPLLLISIISWTAFWLNPSTAFVPQMNVGITSILAAITFNFTIANSLPRVPYLTLMDSYISTCYIFFFLSILATVMIHFWLQASDKPDRSRRLIATFRWLFPVAFVVSQTLVLVLSLI